MGSVPPRSGPRRPPFIDWGRILYGGDGVGFGRHLMRLGLGWPFTADDLKRAYRRKALETHPDRGGNAEDFHAVRKAYEALSDAIR